MNPYVIPKSFICIWAIIEVVTAEIALYILCNMQPHFSLFDLLWLTLDISGTIYIFTCVLYKSISLNRITGTLLLIRVLISPVSLIMLPYTIYYLHRKYEKAVIDALRN